MGDLFSSKSKKTSTSSQTAQSNSTTNQTQNQTSNQGALNLQNEQTSNTSTGNSLNTSAGTSAQSTNSGPSSFQLPYLTQAFDSAAGDHASKSGTPWYQGELYAGMSDQAKADLQATRDFATKNGLGMADTLTSLGTDLTGNFGKASSAIDDYAKAINGNTADDIIAAAQKYAANPYVDSQIDAANRDVTRELNEETLPGIDRQATGTGNINSSRAGVAAGIAQRGAADRMADTSASIRSAAYNQGLTIAQQQSAQKLSGLQNLISAYTGLGGQGISALGTGTTAGYQALSALTAANEAEQADRQGQDTADYQSWMGNDSRASDLLARFYGIIGNNVWGTSGTTTGTTSGTTSASQTGTTIGNNSSSGLALEQGNASGSATATANGTSSGTANGTETTSGGPGLLGATLGALSMAGGLGWQPFAPAKKA